MTRYQTAIGLLKLGKLTFREFIEITGWSRTVSGKVLAELVDRGDIKRVARGTYQILT